MTLSYAEAIAQVTAPGERFETEEVEIRGSLFTAFKAAPRNLRDLFDLTRGDRAGRRYYDQITLFKSVGTAIEDLAAAQLTVQQA